MTELEKAARIALEALRHGVSQLNGIGIPMEADPLHTAIAALTQALATTEPAPKHDEDDGDITGQSGPLPETGWDEVPEGAFHKPSPTAGMNLGERIKHVGGRENAAGYIEFGSVAAVRALVRQYLRDLPAPQPATPERKGEPVARVELMQTGGNAGLATRIVEIDDPLRERLRPGDLLYTSPQVPEDVQKDAERWRKFSGLDYKVRREWASNLSLVPVLTEWVDALPAIDAARKGE